MRTSRKPRPETRALPRILAAIALVALGLSPGVAAVDKPAAVSKVEAAHPAQGHWTWPVTGTRAVIAPFRAPVHTWSPGHRGVDVRARVGRTVRAPAAGRLAFRGVVVDRPLLTIAHEGGLVTTLEPVDSELSEGDWVEAGEAVGTLSTGGHTPRDALHIGVRWHGDYINPMLLFGGVPRAVLLPCCD